MQPFEDLSRTVSTRFDSLRSDLFDRLKAVEHDLPQRFGADTLGQRLRETGWYRQTVDGRWETTGRGSKKDLRAVFLLSCRDLSSELERILVQCQSRCDHLDDMIARQWLTRDSGSNGGRILPVLAEGSRSEEARRRKEWRIRVPLEAESRFCATLAGRWERQAPDLPLLHRLVGEPWGGSRTEGFVGFASRFVDLARSACDAMIWYSKSRWSLLLDGLVVSAQEPSRSVPEPRPTPETLPLANPNPDPTPLRGADHESPS